MARYIDADNLLEELQEEIEFESSMYTEEQNKWFNIGLKCAVRDVKHQPTADVVEVKHGEWVVNPESVDGWEHHMCSACHTDAIFGYKYEADYDEMLDGEWEYIGQREVGINEILTSCCPNCGAKMNGGKK